MQTKKSALSFCVFILPCFIAYVLSAAPHLPHARPQQDANALHRLAAHCHARRFMQANLRALQPPMSETTPGTEPPSPVSPHISDVSAQRKVRGVKRGQETMFGVLSPFAPRRGHGVPRPPKAATITPCHGEKPPSREGHRRLQRQAAVSAEGLPSAEGKEEKEAGTHSHFSQTSGQYPTVACLPFRTTGVFISVPSSSSFSFLSSS